MCQAWKEIIYLEHVGDAKIITRVTEFWVLHVRVQWNFTMVREP